MDKIDDEILKGRSNYLVDNRMVDVAFEKYYHESYQLFRLEFSDFINKTDNEKLKKQITKILMNKKFNKSNRLDAVRKILYKLLDKEIYQIFLKVGDAQKQFNGQSGGKSDKFFTFVNDVPLLPMYKVSNNRKTCEIIPSADKCNKAGHCKWIRNQCKFALTKTMLINFLNKITDELAENDFKSKEILQEGDYYVSDIVDYDRFTERPGQKIIKSTNTAIQKTLKTIFGKDEIPKIGKRRVFKSHEIDYIQLNLNYPLKDMKEMYIQVIIENNISIFRSYVNGFFWLKHQYYNPDTRNLGYFSEIQTILANYFKSEVVDWLLDKNNVDEIKDKLLKYIEIPRSKSIIHDFIVKLSNDTVTLTNCIIELYVLSKLYDYDVFIYDEDNTVIYWFKNGLKYNKFASFGKEPKNPNKKESINIRMVFASQTKIPEEMEMLYFK